MVLLDPWLETLLEEALGDYLENTHQSFHDRSSGFIYHPGPSNLRIQSPNLSPQSLVVTELQKPSRFCRGTVSDGHHSVSFLSPDIQLQDCVSSESWDSGSEVQVYAKVNSVELRVSCCFSPPKVEVFINAFTYTERLRDTQMHDLASTETLASTPSISRLLQRYTDFTRTTEGAEMADSSPRSFKSQACHISVDMENADAQSDQPFDSSPLSQIRLATQQPLAPISQTARQPLSELKPNTCLTPELKTVMESVKSDVDRQLLAQIAEQPVNVWKAQQEVKASQQSIPGILTKGEMPQKTANVSEQPVSIDFVQLSPGSGKHRRSDTVPIKSHPNIERPSQGRDSASLLVQDAETPKISSWVDGRADMHVRFRRWRAEAVAGRYIPRRACKISRLQKMILDSDERWQPPLPGHDQRPATVPIDLLNELTDRADNATNIVQAVHTTNHEQFVRNSQQIVSSAVSMKEPIGKFEDLDSSQELPESCWSASPLREKPADQLPPDSSLPSVASQPADFVAPVRVPSSADEVDQATQVDDNVCTQPTTHSAPSHLSGLSHQHIRSASGQTTQGIACSFHPDPGSELFPAIESGLRIPQVVHVKETPYLGRNKQPLSIPVLPQPEKADSHALLESSTFVPCTFTEDLPRSLQANQPQNAGPKETCTGHQTAAGSPYIRQDLKREYSGESVPASSKRIRAQAEVSKFKETHPDYAAIREDIRQYRRQMLQPLSRTNAAKYDEQPTSGSFSLSPQRSLMSSSDALSGAMTGKEEAAQVSSPLTAPSSRRTSADMQKGLEITSLRGSATESHTDRHLFERFKASYEDYLGDKRQFDSAIALLRKLVWARKAPHPSLFDDFVFHRFHTYRQYFISMADADETPIPYEDYYNQHIESPSHHAKVITARSINETLTSEPSIYSHTTFGTPAPFSSASWSAAERSVTMSRRINNAPGLASVKSSIIEARRSATDNDSSLEHPQPARTVNTPTEHLQPSQKSSVESWLEHTTRAISPELGTPELPRPNNSIPSSTAASNASGAMPPPPRKRHDYTLPPSTIVQHTTSSSAVTRPKQNNKKRKRPSGTPFSPTLCSPSSNQENLRGETKMTPFQRWAQHLLSLPGEPPRPAMVGRSTDERERERECVNVFAWRA